MDVPIAAIKDALWWVEMGLQEADLDEAESQRTRRCILQLKDFIHSRGETLEDAKKLNEG